MPTKQKSGLYRTKVKIGVDASGKPVYKYISGRTKRELEANRQAVIEHYINGTPAAQDRLFGDYAVEWYNVRKAPYIRPGTQNTYRSMLNKHILPTFGDRKLRSIQPLEMQAFLQQFADSSKAHITTARLILSGIFTSTCQDRILEHNPALYLDEPARHKNRREARSDALTARQHRNRLRHACRRRLPRGPLLPRSAHRRSGRAQVGRLRLANQNRPHSTQARLPRQRSGERAQDGQLKPCNPAA